MKFKQKISSNYRLLFMGLMAFAGSFSTISAANVREVEDTLVMRIKAMRCDDCAHKVMERVTAVKGVEDIDFNLERRTATVTYDGKVTCPDSIRNSLRGTRYVPSAYDPKAVILRGKGFKISDMFCQKCADKITNRLKSIEGVDSLAPHLDTQYLFVRYDANKTAEKTLRQALLDLGYTPVNYYTSKNIAYGYYLLPKELATEKTAETAMGLKGVDDAAVNVKRSVLAVTFVTDETTEEEILNGLKTAGIKAEKPKPHECKE
ncbi:MAG: copper ion binding protein [Prevotella sp.]|jgi:copper ion binding protein|nr:copper ion binding protein [Prevotella sp.]MCI1281835.1 copper ion binding protein [Prevotella sp.]